MLGHKLGVIVLSIPAIATLVAVALWILSYSISKRIAIGLGGILAPTIITVAGVVPMLVAVVIVGSYSLPATDIILSAIAGIFACLGSLGVYKSLTTEQLTNSVALQEISPPILVLLGLFAFGEQLTWLQLASILVIFMGTVLILTTEKLRINKRLIPALLSAIYWTIYWVIMSYVTTWSGEFALPIAISRGIGALLILAYFFTSGKNPLKTARSFKNSIKARNLLFMLLALALVAAFADGAADTIFVFVLNSNAVAIGGALIALQPILVSVVGLVLYREKLTALQFTGLIILFAGAFALSAV